MIHFSGMARRIAHTAVARWNSRLTGVYTSHAEALRACGGVGYEKSQLLDLVSEKTRRYAASLSDSDSALYCDESGLVLYAAMQTLLARRIDPVVLDFGGAFGAHYHLLRKLIPGVAALRWGVVETGAMADAARRDNSYPGLTFLDSLSAAQRELGRPNLVYVNNALQYCPDPVATASGLLGLGADVACLAKVAVAGVDKPFFTIQESMLSQNGPGTVWKGFVDSRVRYPLAIVPGKLIESLLGPNYRLSLRYTHPGKLYHSHCGLIEYQSVIAVKQASLEIGGQA